jgi:hypothetical protein
MNLEFEILFRVMFLPKLYRAKVEITYRSENIMRFTVSAGDKELMMEKLLFRKTNQWKITKANFDVSGRNTKNSAMTILAIQNAIDAMLIKIL